MVNIIADAEDGVDNGAQASAQVLPCLGLSLSRAAISTQDEVPRLLSS